MIEAIQQHPYVAAAITVLVILLAILIQRKRKGLGASSKQIITANIIGFSLWLVTITLTLLFMFYVAFWDGSSEQYLQQQNFINVLTALIFIMPILATLISVLVYFSTKKRYPEFARQFKFISISAPIGLLVFFSFPLLARITQ